MIIEFVGLPASGKSALSDHVATWLCDEHFNTARRTCRRTPEPGVHRHSLQHPRMVATVAHQLARSNRRWPERWFAFRRTLVTAGTLVWAREWATSDHPLVLAEGICQRAFQVFVDGEGAGDRAAVRRFLAAAPHPDVVIALKVRPATALKRLRQRGYGALSHRFAGLDDTQLHDRFTAGQQLLLDAVCDLRELSDGRVRTVILDGERLDEAFTTVELALPSLLRQRPTPQPLPSPRAPEVTR